MTEKEYRNLDEQAPEWYITSQASLGQQPPGETRYSAGLFRRV